MIAAAGADRLLVVDPHMPGFEAICRIPVEILTACRSSLTPSASKQSSMLW